MPRPSDGALLQHYRRTRYAPRSRDVYVASLYRDPPLGSADDGSGSDADDADDDGRCACGSMDPLHVVDARCGVTSRSAAAQAGFAGYTALSDSLERLSCDPLKRAAIVSSSHEDEVDDLIAARSPPAARWNEARGRGVNQSFDQWLAAKHSADLEREAADKKAALAELVHQLVRREASQQQFRMWKENKSTEASRRAAAAREEMERSQPPSASEVVRRQREKDAEYEQWCAEKDAARLVAAQRRRDIAETKAAQAAAQRTDKTQRAAVAFSAWTADTKAALDAKRQQRRKEAHLQRAEASAAKAARKAKATEEVAAYRAKVKKRAQAEEEVARSAERVEREAKEKRAKDVAATRAEHEKKERAAEEAKEALAAKQHHKLIWQKKATPVGYSTLQRPQITFR